MPQWKLKKFIGLCLYMCQQRKWWFRNGNKTGQRAQKSTWDKMEDVSLYVCHCKLHDSIIYYIGFSDISECVHFNFTG